MEMKEIAENIYAAEWNGIPAGSRILYYLQADAESRPARAGKGQGRERTQNDNGTAALSPLGSVREMEDRRDASGQELV